MRRDRRRDPRHRCGRPLARQVLAVLAVPVALAGCIGGLGLGGDDGEKLERVLRLETITLTAQRGVNGDWPVPVELVRLRDPALVREALRIETRSWFGEAGDAFRSAHAEERYDAWEVVPGGVVGPQMMQVDRRVAGVLFCGTRSSPPPLRFERDGDVVVHIGDEGCSITGGEPSSGDRWYSVFGF